MRRKPPINFRRESPWNAVVVLAEVRRVLNNREDAWVSIDIAWQGHITDYGKVPKFARQRIIAVLEGSGLYAGKEGPRMEIDQIGRTYEIVSRNGRPTLVARTRFRPSEHIQRSNLPNLKVWANPLDRLVAEELQKFCDSRSRPPEPYYEPYRTDFIKNILPRIQQKAQNTLRRMGPINRLPLIPRGRRKPGTVKRLRRTTTGR